MFLFSAVEKKNKNLGEEAIVKRNELVVQRLSTEPKSSTMKYSREGPREFVSFDFEEVTIENIRAACISHFGENKQCDVLASEQGPSCSRVDQPGNLTLIYVRFTAPLEEEIFLKPSSPKVAKSESASAKKNIPSVVPKSL